MFAFLTRVFTTAGLLLVGWYLDAVWLYGLGCVVCLFVRFVCTICGWDLLLLDCFLCIFKLCWWMVVYYCLLLQVLIINGGLLLSWFAVDVVMWFGFPSRLGRCFSWFVLVIWFMSSICLGLLVSCIVDSVAGLLQGMIGCCCFGLIAFRGLWMVCWCWFWCYLCLLSWFRCCLHSCFGCTYCLGWCLLLLFVKVAVFMFGLGNLLVCAGCCSL